MSDLTPRRQFPPILSHLRSQEAVTLVLILRTTTPLTGTDTLWCDDLG